MLVDAHSKWVEIYPTSGPSSKETIRWLQHCFATFGLPVTVVSDNGPCFTSEEFKVFMRNSGIKHLTSAPYHPSTNGLAERMVQTFKQAIHKSKEPVQLTLDRFLFNYRLTPHSATGVSPAELMLGRRPRCRLDLLWPAEGISAQVFQRQKSQRQNHSTSPRIVDIPVSAPVMVRDYSTRPSKWSPAVVSEQTGPLSYKCQLNERGVVRRHLDQIHTRSEITDNGLEKISGTPCVGGS